MVRPKRASGALWALRSKARPEIGGHGAALHEPRHGIALPRGSGARRKDGGVGGHALEDLRVREVDDAFEAHALGQEGAEVLPPDPVRKKVDDEM